MKNLKCFEEFNIINEGKIKVGKLVKKLLTDYKTQRGEQIFKDKYDDLDLEEMIGKYKEHIIDFDKDGGSSILISPDGKEIKYKNGKLLKTITNGKLPDHEIEMILT